MSNKLTTEEFIQRSSKIHNNKFDYSKVNYTGINFKVIIACPVHGEFNQVAKNHLKGQGCKKCALVINSKKAQDSRRSNIDEFLIQAKEKHGDKFDYSLVEYKNDKTKVEIICPEHGIFEQTPNGHKKSGCEKCAHYALNSNIEDFIKVSTEVHGGKYIYSASTYTGCDNKITITCPIHGDFQQKAYLHKQGRGCPICSDSTGEREIRKFLEKHEIKFISQKKFDDCKNVFPLRFDFYLPEHNLCIEFDGLQHFKRAGYDKDGSALKRTQFNDNIKNQYCNQKGIGLLRIKFDEDIKTKIQSLL